MKITLILGTCKASKMKFQKRKFQYKLQQKLLADILERSFVASRMTEKSVK
jgi:hypothetical protein